MVGASHGKSASCIMSCPWVLCKCRYNIFILSGVFTRPPHGEVMLTFGWELVAVIPHPDKFGERRHCNSDYIMFLICHVTSRDGMFYGLCESNESKLATVTHNLVMFGGH